MNLEHFLHLEFKFLNIFKFAIIFFSTLHRCNLWLLLFVEIFEGSKNYSVLSVSDINTTIWQHKVATTTTFHSHRKISNLWGPLVTRVCESSLHSVPVTTPCACSQHHCHISNRKRKKRCRLNSRLVLLFLKQDSRDFLCCLNCLLDTADN